MGGGEGGGVLLGSRTCGFVCTGEGDASWVRGTRPSDGKLVAADSPSAAVLLHLRFSNGEYLRNVKLGASQPRCRMQGDRLGAQEIVAWGEIRWDLNVHLPAIGIQILRPPIVVRALRRRGSLAPGVLEHFEEAAGAVGRGRVGNFAHVN